MRIVEAIIQWQARTQRPFESEVVQEALARQLPDYQSESLQRMHLEATVSGQNESPTVQHHKGWHGFKLTSADKLTIVQFTRDGVGFSRLRPYLRWEQFLSAAKAVWAVFVDMAAPLEIQRLGLRYINQIPIKGAESLGEILRQPPTCPSNLPLNDFVYQGTFTVPNHPFGIRVIKVMQPHVPVSRKPQVSSWIAMSSRRSRCRVTNGISTTR